MLRINNKLNIKNKINKANLNKKAIFKIKLIFSKGNQGLSQLLKISFKVF